MRNNMKELDITKAYYLGDLDKEQRGKLFDYLLNIDYTFKTTRKRDFQKIDTDYIFYDIDEWEWYSKIEFVEKEIDLEVVNALNLFEPQFKQGDKVLVSDNGKDWVERIFVFEYKGYYNCELKNKDCILVSWKHIKPYEEEIKVGDWVIVNNEQAIIKINEQGIKYLDSYTKITDEVLINKLNEL